MTESVFHTRQLDAGDVLLFRVEGRLPAEVRDRLSEQLGAAFTANRVIVLDESTTVEVWRPPAPPTPLTDAATDLVEQLNAEAPADDLTMTAARWLPGDDDSPTVVDADHAAAVAEQLLANLPAEQRTGNDELDLWTALGYEDVGLAQMRFIHQQRAKNTVPRPGYTLTDLMRMKRTETTTSTVRNGLGEVVEETIIHHPATVETVVRASEDLEDEDLADLAERECADRAEAELTNRVAAYTSAAKEFVLARWLLEKGDDGPERLDAARENLDATRTDLATAAKSARHSTDDTSRIATAA
jgi:hypothetical protein